MLSTCQLTLWWLLESAVHRHLTASSPGDTLEALAEQSAEPLLLGGLMRKREISTRLIGHTPTGAVYIDPRKNTTPKKEVDKFYPKKWNACK